MPDTDQVPTSTAGSTLGNIINPSDIKSAIDQSRQERSYVQSRALDLPKTLQASREQEASDIGKLGPIPQLTPEQMKSYLGKPPQPAPTSLVEQWGSPAMLIALIGSAFTRMPLTNALNAGAQVMKAYQQRDFDAAQTAFKEWKEHNDTAIKLLDIQSNAYSQAIKAIRETTGEQRKDAIAELTALGHSFNDRPLTDALNAGRYDIAVQRQDDLNKQRDNLVASRDSLVTAQKAGSEYAAAVKTYDAAVKTGDPTSINEAKSDMEEKKKSFDLASQVNTEARGKGGGGGDGETRVQAKQNAEISEARDKYQKLLDGETVQYGGYDIGPDDLKNPVATLEGAGPDPKQRAIQQMRKMAGAPIVKGTTAEPVPQFKPTPKETPKTDADKGASTDKNGTGPSEADKEMLAHAGDAMAKGAPREAVRKRYIEAGGNAADFDARYLPDTPPAASGF